MMFVYSRRFRAFLWGLLFTDEASHDGEMVDAGDGNVKGVVFGVVGDAKDVVLFFGRSHALDDNALVGVEHVGFAPLEEGAGVLHFSTRHDVAAEIAGAHAFAFDSDEELAVAERGDEIPFYLVGVDVGCAFEKPRHGGQGNERQALAGGRGYELRRWGVFRDRGLSRCARAEHFTFACEKPHF